MEKERLITVKGIGTLTVPVDYIEIQFHLRETNKEYEKGYDLFEKHILDLQNTLTSCGFEKKELKTSEVNVVPDYDRVKKNGRYTEVLKEYDFGADLILRFDFDSQKLADVIKSVSKSKSAPEIEIDFTVKDKEAVKKNLLVASAKDAREKADLLCEAMNVKLGKLLTINYNWDEITIHSPTNYRLEDPRRLDLCCCERSLIDFTPDDIRVNDDASFVWEITD